MQCKQCGSENGQIKSGISKKNGNAWKGFKCSDCDTMTFINAPKQAPVQTFNKPAVVPPDHAKKEMLISYAKDIVVAEIAKGEVKEPFKRVADGFKVLMMAYTYPFGKPQVAKLSIPDVDINEEIPLDEEAPF